MNIHDKIDLMCKKCGKKLYKWEKKLKKKKSNLEYWQEVGEIELLFKYPKVLKQGPEES